MTARRRAIFLASTRADLLAIQRHVAEQSGSMATGERLAASLREHCRRLATFTTMMGRPRPDLGTDVRSSPCGSYIVLFRYRGDRFEVLAIVERHRDIQAFSLSPVSRDPFE